MSKNILIIGASRGLGKGLYDKYTKEKYNVFKSTRKKIKNEKNNKNVIQLDLNKIKSFQKIKIDKTVKFSIVFFVAALIPLSKEINKKKCLFGNFDYKEYEKFMKINCFSHIKFFETLYKKNYIEKNAKIIFVSSSAASIELRGRMKHHSPGGNLFYRISKSALNSAMKNISYALSNKNLIIISLDPGWLNKSKIKNKKEQLSVKESTKKIFNVVKKLTKNQDGKFINLNFKEVPW